ncbi:MAG: YbbR-like domain-containing protein [Thermodesulfobacteriota bacterium]
MENLATKKIKKWFDRPWPKNWVLKLISFFFALFLWYFVVGEDKVDKTINIPVEILNMPANLTISNQFKNELEITVTGPRGLIRNLDQQHIYRPIDLSRAEPGTRVFQNTEDSISLPRGVRLLRVKPTDIILQLDMLVKKNIPIQAVSSGEPPAGFTLVSITTDPPTLPVTGPQILVEQHDAISTSPIDVSRLTASTTRPVALELPPAISDLVGNPVVNATIVIKEKKEEKTIKGIPVRLLLSGRKISILTPETVTVTARIPYTTVRETKDLKTLFRARIIGVDLAVGKHTLPVEIIPAEDVEIVTVSPDSVTADIRDEESGGE